MKKKVKIRIGRVELKDRIELLPARRGFEPNMRSPHPRWTKSGMGFYVGLKCLKVASLIVGWFQSLMSSEFKEDKCSKAESEMVDWMHLSMLNDFTFDKDSKAESVMVD